MWNKRQSALFHYLKRKIYDYVLFQNGLYIPKLFVQEYS